MRNEMLNEELEEIKEENPDNVRWILTELRADVRHVGMMTQATRQEVAELRIQMDERFREHWEYHKRNESRWGAVRWMERHPWAAVLIMITLLTGLREQPDMAAEVFGALKGNVENVGD